MVRAKNVDRLQWGESCMIGASLVAQKVRESACNAGDQGSIPGLGRSPGGGRNGNPLHYSCLGNLMDIGGWQATVHGSQRARHD